MHVCTIVCMFASNHACKRVCVYARLHAHMLFIHFNNVQSVWPVRGLELLSCGKKNNATKRLDNLLETSGEANHRRWFPVWCGSFPGSTCKLLGRITQIPRLSKQNPPTNLRCIQQKPVHDLRGVMFCFLTFLSTFAHGTYLKPSPERLDSYGTIQKHQGNPRATPLFATPPRKFGLNGLLTALRFPIKNHQKLRFPSSLGDKLHAVDVTLGKKTQGNEGHTKRAKNKI